MQKSSNCTRSFYRINQEVLNKCDDSDLGMLCELIRNFIKMTPDQKHILISTLSYSMNEILKKHDPDDR